MGEYERRTAASIADMRRRAEEMLTERLPLEKVEEDERSITLAGADGTVTITAHRHGPETIVHAATDRLRTSRLDNEAQRFLTYLPYQPGDARRPSKD